MADTQGGAEESPSPPAQGEVGRSVVPAENGGPEPASAPPAPGERPEPAPDRQAALPTTVIRGFTAVGAVVGVLAGISVFTAPFAKTGSALVWTTVAVLAAATLLAAGFVGLSTRRGKRITAPIGALAALVVLALAAGAGVGYAAWHRTVVPVTPASTAPMPTAPMPTAPMPTAPTTAAPTTAPTIPVGLVPTGPVVYDQSVGEGCPHPGSGASITMDDPRAPLHPWTQERAATWAVESCDNALLYSDLSGDAAAWINDFGWTFTNVPTDARCWFSVYIADSSYSRYIQAQYYTTDTVGTYGQDPSFTIDQGTTHGAWVQEYSTAVHSSTGTAQLLLTDAGSGAPGQAVTASVVRLECV